MSGRAPWSPAFVGLEPVAPVMLDFTMNRAFPGRRDGSVTRMIAHFVQHRILEASERVRTAGELLRPDRLTADSKLPTPRLLDLLRAGRR